MEVWYRHASGKKDENQVHWSVFKNGNSFNALWGQKNGCKKN